MTVEGKTEGETADLIEEKLVKWQKTEGLDWQKVVNLNQG